MNKKLKSFLCLFFVFALLLTSVDISMWYNNKDKQSEAAVGTFTSTIPFKYGSGYFDFKGKWGDEVSAVGFSKKEIFDHRTSEGELYRNFYIHGEKNSNGNIKKPVIDESKYILVKNAGRMLVNGKYQKVDCRLFAASNNVVGSVIRVHKEKDARIRFSSARIIDTIKSADVSVEGTMGSNANPSKKIMWRHKNSGLATNAILLRVKFYVAGTNTLVENPNGVIYFNDLDRNAAGVQRNLNWNEGVGIGHTTSTQVYTSGSNSAMKKAVLTMGDTPFTYYYGNKEHSISGAAGMFDWATLGFGFTANKYVEFVYNASTGFTTSTYTRSSNVKFHVNNALPAGYSKPDSLQPITMYLAKYTAVDKNSVQNQFTDLRKKGYNFSGWHSGSYNGTKASSISSSNYKNSAYSKMYFGGAEKGLIEELNLYGVYSPKEVTFNVQKSWVKGTNVTIPSSLKVNLKKGSSTLGSVTLSASNNWSGSVKLTYDKCIDGSGNWQPPAWEEEVPTGWKASNPVITTSTDATGAVTTSKTVLTNTQPSINLTVTKSWSGGSARPSVPVKLQIKRKGQSTFQDVGVSTTLSSSNSWRYSTTVPYPDGSQFQWVETSVPDGYKSSVSNGSVTGSGTSYSMTTTITNTYDKMPVEVQKNWEDLNNTLGWRPSSISVGLYKKVGSGSWTKVKTVSLNSGNSWKHVEDMPKTEGSSTVQYKYQEDTVPSRYIKSESTVSANGGYKTTITNTAEGLKTLTVRKSWASTTADTPTSVQVTLKRSTNGSTTSGTVVGTYTLSASNNWTTSVVMPGKDGSTTYTYFWDEVVPAGYTMSKSVSGDTTTITNTEKKKSLTVRKVWDNQYADEMNVTQPGSISVELYRTQNGVSTKINTLTIGSTNAWRSSVSVADVYNKDGTPCKYEFKEVTPRGYIPSYEVSGTTTTITNKVNRRTEMIEVTCKKVWVGDENPGVKAAYRPSEIKLLLERKLGEDGSWEHVNDYTINEYNGWEMSGGIFVAGYASDYTPYYYRWVEENPYGSTALDNYEESQITHGAMSGSQWKEDTVITNTLKAPVTVDFKIRKTWDTYTDDYKNLTIEAMITKKVNGVWQRVSTDYYGTSVGSAGRIPLNQGNNWKADFVMPKFNDDGTECVYNVEEMNKPEGYTSSVSLGGSSNVQYGTTGYIATIKNVQEKIKTTSVVISKTWANVTDESLIPDEITVELHGHSCYRTCADTKIQEVTLKKSEGWKKTINDLPRYQLGEESGFSPTVYYVVEKYEGSSTLTNYFDSPNYGYMFGLTHAQVSSGNVHSYLNSISIKDENSDTGLVTYNCYIRNTMKTPTKINVELNKVWDGNGSISGYMPDAVDFGMYKCFTDGTRKRMKTVTLYASDDWTYTETDLLNSWKDPETGKMINGYAFEEEMDDYTKLFYETDSIRVTPSSEGNLLKFTCYNINLPCKLVTITKTWQDQNDFDKIRPDSISAGVFFEGYESHGSQRIVELSKDNNWTEEFYMPSKNPDGLDASYIVREVAVSGYRSQVVRRISGSSFEFEITNVHEPVVPKARVKVNKTWDKSGYYGTMPSTNILFDVIRHQEGKEDVIVSNLSMTSSDRAVSSLPLPLYVNWEPVTYSVREKTEVPGFTSNMGNTVFNAIDNVFEASVTNMCDTQDVRIEKVWDDNNNAAGTRPDSVRIKVYNEDKSWSETYTLNEENGWAIDLVDQPTWSAGGKMFASAEELDPPSGYKSKVEVIEGGGTVIRATNTKADRYTTATVQKVWNDNNNSENMRPSYIYAGLYRNGEYVTKVQLSDENNWTVTMEDLPAVNGGTEEYYWEEETRTDGYRYTRNTTQNATTNPSNYKTVLTNTLFVPPKKNVSVRKVWNDSGNSSSRPSEIKVQCVFAESGFEVGDPITLNAANNWSATVSNLDASTIDGDPLEYAFMENGVPLDYSSSVVTSGNSTTITNTKKVEKFTTAEVVKKWSDTSTANRPSYVTVQLYRNGDTPIGDPVRLSASNSWKASVSNLFTEIGGTYCTYSWEEVFVPDGYTATYKTTKSDTTNTPAKYTTEITNHAGTIPTVTATARKVWSDGSNIDNKRPDSVTVQLYRNTTEPVGRPIVLDSSNNWSYTVRDLNKLSNGTTGTTNSYTFKEVDIPEGYTVSYSTTKDTSGNSTTTVTNKYTPAARQTLSVEKVWDDENNVDRKRPTSVRVQLYRDETTAVGNPITLNASNSWRSSVSNLPTQIDGEAVTYKFVELDPPEDYEVSYAVTGTKTVITNKYDAKRAITVTKKVKKTDLYSPFAEPEFVFKLEGTLKDGTAVSYRQKLKPVEVQDDGTYLVATYTWDNIKVGNYLLEEIPVDRYELDSITGLTTGAVKENNSKVRIDFITNSTVKSASATFINRLKDYAEYTHSSGSEMELK